MIFYSFHHSKISIIPFLTLEFQLGHPVPAFVNKTHFDEDYVSRGIVENFLQRVHNIDEQIGDAKILLDHDNYQDAISFYRHIRYLANENSPGMTSVYKDMQQFFKNSPINGDDAAPTKKE